MDDSIAGALTFSSVTAPTVTTESLTPTTEDDEYKSLLINEKVDNTALTSAAGGSTLSGTASDLGGYVFSQIAVHKDSYTFT